MNRILKEHVGKVNKDGRALLPSSNSEFNLHSFRLQVLLNMDTHRSSRRVLKPVQEQEDQRPCRNKRELDMLQR